MDVSLHARDTGERLAYLDNLIDGDTLSVTLGVNAESILRFEAADDGTGKTDLLQSPSYIIFDGLLFDVSYIEQRRTERVSYRVECEHVSYRLLDLEPAERYEGSPPSILMELLSQTDLVPGLVEYPDGSIVFETGAANKLSALREFAAQLGLKIDFSGWVISLRDISNRNRGFSARFGKNIQGIRKIIDRRKNETSYEVDLADLRNHPLYADFQELERVEEGDEIRIVDEAMGIDAIQRVVSRTYGRGGRIQRLEIANRIEMLPEAITSIVDETVNQAIANLDISRVVTQEVIVNNLYADFGSVSDLTVDRFRTDREKPWRYLRNDPSPLYWQFKAGEVSQMIVDRVLDPELTEQLTTPNGDPLFWLDYPGGQMTVSEFADQALEDDALPVPRDPVIIYAYTSYTQYNRRFVEKQFSWGVGYIPVTTHGYGDEQGRRKVNEYTDGQGYVIEYEHPNGETYWLRIGDNGVDAYPPIGGGGVGLTDWDRLDIQQNSFEVFRGASAFRFDTPRDGQGRIIGVNGHGRNRVVNYPP